jgi:dolichol-phosphate mannosyltransferase
MEKKISIILSTYNEAVSIEKTIINLRKEINNLELVIVDDNSPDGTFDILKKYENENTKIICRTKSRGLASAFLCGMLNTTGKYIGWLDSNMGELAFHFPKMIDELDNNDIILLSRYVEGGSDKRNQTRVLSSELINFICNIFLTNKIKDFTSSIFLMRKEVLNSAVPICYGHGEFFIEFLFKCYKKKIKIKEIPYTQLNDLEGNSKTAPNIIKFIYLGYFYFLRIIKARFRGD